MQGVVPNGQDRNEPYLMGDMTRKEDKPGEPELGRVRAVLEEEGNAGEGPEAGGIRRMSGRHPHPHPLLPLPSLTALSSQGRRRHRFCGIPGRWCRAGMAPGYKAPPPSSNGTHRPGGWRSGTYTMVCAMGI